MPAADEFVQRIKENIQLAREKIAVAQQRQKDYADQHRRDVSFQPGDRGAFEHTQHSSGGMEPASFYRFGFNQRSSDGSAR